jgi:Amt family ammonium transporter
VAITPASGFVTPMPALLIGLVAGIGCFLMVTFVKGLFGYDDALDAFGVHGAGGTIGALLTGVFANRTVNAVFHDAQGQPLPVGWLDGNASQIGYQLVGILIAWSFALVGTVVLLKITDLVVGVRASEAQESEGLDLTEHGEEAYNLEM